MKTLADEIIEGCIHEKKIINNSLLNTPGKISVSKLRRDKPKSAGNKSFRIHNSLKFMKSVERSRIGKENKQ